MPANYSIFIVLEVGIRVEFLLLTGNRQINVSNLVVHNRNKINPCYFGDYRKCFRVLPSFKDKLAMSATVNKRSSYDYMA